MLQFHGRAQSVRKPSADDSRTRYGPQESDEDEAYFLLMPLNALCSSIERMALDARMIPILRPAFGELMARTLNGCRSVPIRRALLAATRHVDSHAYNRALALLRALAP